MSLSLYDKIKYFNEPCLSENTNEVTDFGDKTIELADLLLAKVEQYGGYAIAANQLGISKSVFAFDWSGHTPGARGVMFNARIEDTYGEIAMEEGCLSIPRFYWRVVRPESVKIVAQNEHGKEVTFETDGMLARVAQHEIDHANGILMFDRIEDDSEKKLARRKAMEMLTKVKALNKALDLKALKDKTLEDKELKVLGQKEEDV